MTGAHAYPPGTQPGPSFAERYSKALAALVGSVTPSAVIGVLGLIGVHLAPAWAAVIVAAVTTVATWLAPANAPQTPVAPPADPAPPTVPPAP